VDANLLNLSPQQIREQVEGYPVVGITAMTPTIHEAVKIANELCDKIIILGGVHASVFPDECTELRCFDTVVVGEGEISIVEILKDIESQRLRNKYDAFPVCLDTLPLPDYSLLDLPKYKARYPHMARTPWTIASTSRGCPYSCSFCVKAVSGKTFHGMSSDRMLELVNNLQNKHGIRDISFYDDLFTHDTERVRMFCDGILYSDIDLSWTCESRVNMRDPFFLTLMHTAGCRLIYYGIESGNQEILNRLSKGIRLDQIRKAVKTTQDCGIQAAGYFMLGCPGETSDTMRETVEFSQELNLDHAQFSVCSPLPGSRLYQEYLKVGYPSHDWQDFRYLGGNSDKPMFTSSELSREQIEQAVKEANEIFTGKKEVK
jgi:radical SAM superfamily enzyme YgiQ (UPF0313 family)